MSKGFAQKLKKIKVFAVDVDGVLTNGEIILDHQGKEIKVFDVQDGLGLVILKRLGFKTAIISARFAPAVTARAKDLKFDKVYQDAYPKLAAYQQLLKELRASDDEVCFIGDDIPDIEVLKRVGFAAAVSNAIKEVKDVADYVTRKEGGCGAVREVIEMILRAHGLWEKVLTK